MARDLAGDRGDPRLDILAAAEDDMVMLDGFEPPGLSRVCTPCHHFRRRQGRTCAAFPERDSIPMPIWLAEHDHRTPYPGDRGIRFEPVEVPRPAPAPSGSSSPKAR